MTNANVAPVNFLVITINRAKEVVRRSEVSNFKAALDTIASNMVAATTNNWRTYINGTYQYPHYVVRKNNNYAGTFVTSFSMINGKKADGGDYYFTYIKKVA